MPRKLSLKKDVLQELTSDELRGVNAGTRDTLYSCYTYISCFVTDCLPTFDGCIE